MSLTLKVDEFDPKKVHDCFFLIFYPIFCSEMWKNTVSFRGPGVNHWFFWGPLKMLMIVSFHGIFRMVFLNGKPCGSPRILQIIGIAENGAEQTCVKQMGLNN